MAARKVVITGRREACRLHDISVLESVEGGSSGRVALMEVVLWCVGPDFILYYQKYGTNYFLIIFFLSI